MDIRRSLVICAAALIATLGIAGCKRKAEAPTGDTAAGPPVQGDWVVTHEISDAETLSPITAQDATSQEIFTYLYESLTIVDPDSLYRIPQIAAELPTTDSAHITYDFKLNKNAKFSDGHPVTAADFVFYLKAIKNPYIANALPSRGYYVDVKEVEPLNGDPYTLHVIMAKPYYLADQVVGDMLAIPKHIWDPKGLSDKMTFDELNAGDPKKNPAIRQLADQLQDVTKGFSGEYLVGSGPYMFQEWRRNEQLVLVRNPNYWNKEDKYGKAYPDKIVWRTINDQSAAVTALKNGTLDVMPRIEKIQYKTEKPKFPAYNLKPVEYDYPSYTYIGYNEKNPLFADKHIRKALSLLVDRGTIIKNLYYGLARPVQSPIFYKRPEYDSTLPVITYNVEEAKRLLEQGGWKDTDGDGTLDKMINGVKTDFKFTILLNAGNQIREKIATLFVDALRKVGIDASTARMEWTVFIKRTREGDFEAYVGGWALNTDEGDMYQIWHSASAGEGGSNTISYNNPKVDSLIVLTRSQFDFEKRKDYYLQIQKILYDDQPYTFLVSEKFTGAYSGRYQNARFYAPRPCYKAGLWWTPKSLQRSKNATQAPQQ